MRPLPFLSGHRGSRAWIGLSLLAVLAFFAWMPEKSAPSPFAPVCVFHQLTGLPCALCGGTRSARALLHGDLSRAMQLNALALPAVALIFLAAIALIAEAAIGRPLADWEAWFRRAFRFWPAGLSFLLVWWIFQIDGALRGSKSELLDLRNPIAHALSERFSHQDLPSTPSPAKG